MEQMREPEQADFDPEKQSIVYTFITFRSMDGVEMIEEAYRYSYCERFWLHACQCICREKHARLKSRYIGGRWPAPEPAILPENILWQNMAYSRANLACRRLLVALVIIAALILSFWAITTVQGLKNETTGKPGEETVKLAPKCPPAGVARQTAFDDQQLPPALQQGLMGCYCFDRIVKQGDVLASSTTFIDIDATNSKPYCETWLRGWLVERLVKYGAPAMIAVINVIVSAIFKYTAPFEKQFTMNDETSSTFAKLTVLQFLNIAVLLLV